MVMISTIAVEGIVSYQVNQWIVYVKVKSRTKCCRTSPYLKVAVYPQALKERKCFTT